MTIKTKSEVMAELEKDASVIRKHLGKDYEVKAHDFAYGGAYIEISNSEFKFGHINGVIRQYTPNPDTKDEAIEKVKTEYFKKCKDKTSTWCSISMFEKENKFMMTWGNVDDEDGERYFPFVENDLSTDPITDEVPPKGMAVEGGSGAHYLSLGEWDRGRLAVMDKEGNLLNIALYKSLTTPHRSGDWED